MSTTKTVLLVAGVGVGLYVVYNLVSPSATAKRTTSTSVGASNAGSFVGIASSIGAGLAGLFSSKPGSTPSYNQQVTTPSYQQGYEDAVFSANQGPDTASVQDTEDAFAVAQDPFGAFF